MDSTQRTKLLLGMLIFIFTIPARAVDLLVESGLHFGGDTITTVNTKDGSTDSLKAGEELSIAAGTVFAMGESMQFVISFGMKKEVVYPDDGAITFTRYPLDMLLLYQSNKWHYGGGLTAHMNPVYKVDTDSDKQTIEFKNAFGALFDMRYFVFEEVFVAGRITWIKYEVENDPDNTSYNGSSIGVMIGFQL